jgi:hypothetical protein
MASRKGRKTNLPTSKWHCDRREVPSLTREGVGTRPHHPGSTCRCGRKDLGSGKAEKRTLDPLVPYLAKISEASMQWPGWPCSMLRFLASNYISRVSYKHMRWNVVQGQALAHSSLLGTNEGALLPPSNIVSIVSCILCVEHIISVTQAPRQLVSHNPIHHIPILQMRSLRFRLKITQLVSREVKFKPRSVWLHNHRKRGRERERERDLQTI